MNFAVIGSVFVDLKGFPFKKLNPGKRNAGYVEQVQGGVARNIAEDIAHTGEQVTFVGLVDESSAGADVLSHLKSLGVETKYMRRTADGMGTWLVVFDGSLEFASISKRPDLRPIQDILCEHGDEIFTASDAILLEFDLEPETVDTVYRLAARHGKPVYAAVSNIEFALENRSYFPQTACFVCNEGEAYALFPGVLDDLALEEKPKALQLAMKAAGMQSAIVTLARNGAIYASADSCGHIPAREVTVVDNAGPGDAFFAGVCVGLVRGTSLRKACSIGTELAAMVLSTKSNVCPDTVLDMEENA